MKAIGLIGGMSWESTAVYYQLINTMVRNEFGALHSAEILMRSFDLAPIKQLIESGNWQKAATILVRAAQWIELGGAECLVLCTNTMHKSAPLIESQITIPLIHVVEETGKALEKQGVMSPLLLSTRFTIEERVYADYLADRFGIVVRVPILEEQEFVHRTIYTELCNGVVNATSRRRVVELIERSARRGCDGVILGCTEIGLLIKQSDVTPPLFDSAAIHAAAAVRFALSR